MAILSETILSQPLWLAQAGFHLIFTSTSGRCPLRARNTIELCGDDSRDSSTTAMRVPLETEFAPAKLAPHQQHRCGGNDHQRHRLLPIHARNITSNWGRATNDSTRGTHISCHSLDKMCKPILSPLAPRPSPPSPPSPSATFSLLIPQPAVLELGRSRLEDHRPCQRDAGSSLIPPETPCLPAGRFPASALPSNRRLAHKPGSSSAKRTAGRAPLLLSHRSIQLFTSSGRPSAW